MQLPTLDRHGYHKASDEKNIRTLQRNQHFLNKRSLCSFSGSSKKNEDFLIIVMDEDCCTQVILSWLIYEITDTVILKE